MRTKTVWNGRGTRKEQNPLACLLCALVTTMVLTCGVLPAAALAEDSSAPDSPALQAQESENPYSYMTPAESVQFGTWYDGTGDGDWFDSYGIDAENPGRITITFESMFSDAQVEIASWNWRTKRDPATGVQDAGQEAPLIMARQDGLMGTPDEPATATLSAWVAEGRYVLVVSSGEQAAFDGAYRFKVEFDDSKAVEREFNDDTDHAVSLEACRPYAGLLASWGQRHDAESNEWVHDADCYAIEVPANALAMVKLTWPSGEGEPTLEAVGVDVAEQGEGNSRTFTFATSWEGTQYVIVRPANGDPATGDGCSGRYTITWSLDFTLAEMDSVEAQRYTGNAIRPRPDIWLGVERLVEGTDYVLSYENNVGMGIAKVTATGTGCFEGTLTTTFRIASDGPFADVASVTAHEDDILWLRSQGITAGWTEEDGFVTYRPNAGVKRGDMAAFLFRLAKKWGLASDSWQPTASQRRAFRDVNTSTSHAREIWWLAAKGISAGWKTSGGMEFRPNAEVKRGDMAAFLFRLAKAASKGDATDGWKASSSQSKTFRDVASRTSHSREIWWLAAKGVSSGWSVGSRKEFRPNTTVKRGDMAAFLHRMNGLKKTTTPAKPSTPSTPTTPTKPTTPTTPTSDYVIVTKTGKKYHRPSGCRSTAGKATTRLSLSEAKRRGYTPCANCYH